MLHAAFARLAFAQGQLAAVIIWAPIVRLTVFGQASSFIGLLPPRFQTRLPSSLPVILRQVLLLFQLLDSSSAYWTISSDWLPRLVPASASSSGLVIRPVVRPGLSGSGQAIVRVYHIRSGFVIIVRLHHHLSSTSSCLDSSSLTGTLLVRALSGRPGCQAPGPGFRRRPGLSVVTGSSSGSSSGWLLAFQVVPSFRSGSGQDCQVLVPSVCRLQVTRILAQILSGQALLSQVQTCRQAFVQLCQLRSSQLQSVSANVSSSSPNKLYCLVNLSGSGHQVRLLLSGLFQGRSGQSRTRSRQEQVRLLAQTSGSPAPRPTRFRSSGSGSSGFRLIIVRLCAFALSSGSSGSSTVRVSWVRDFWVFVWLQASGFFRLTN